MNNAIFYFFYNFAHQSPSIDNAIVFFAVYFQYVIIALAIIFLYFYHKKLPKEIFEVFYGGILAWTLASLLKIFFQTQRPFEVLGGVNPLFSPGDHAFPSGHATFFFALAFSLFFHHKKTGYLFMLFALIISLARIAAGVHFPSDIFGGICLGFIISFIIDRLTKK